MEVSREKLFQLYCEEKLSSPKIATILGCSCQTVLNLLRTHGIGVRDRHNCQNIFKVSKDILVYLYVNQKNSLRVVAGKLGVTDETVRRRMAYFGISRRLKTENFGAHNKGKKTSLKVRLKLSKTRKKLFKDGKIRHWNKGNYTPEKTRNKISGTLLMGREPAPSFYGKDWIKQRTSCLQRDNYTCQQCESMKNLQVHHWEPYRFSVDNSLENLVTLCFKCHRRKHKEYILEGFIAQAESEYYA